MKTLFVFFVVTIITSSCIAQDLKCIGFSGVTQGTTYAVTYYETDSINYQSKIDSILTEYDNSVSIYNPNSIISRINKNDSDVIADSFFIENFTRAMFVSEKTGGAFDVTVAPLVNAWGFGFTDKARIDSALIDSILDFVGYKLICLQGNKAIKKDSRIMLDFNAIAQGYSVDIIAKFLENKGIINYLIEIGGEVKAKGKKENNKSWKVGIEKPSDNKKGKKLKAVIELDDKALATSGNYRKFYFENGIRYSHTINPETGYPVRHSLLSVSVFADKCITADAYATAFMVMGLEKAKEFLLNNRELEAYFIYSDEKGNLKTYATEEIDKILNEKE